MSRELVRLRDDVPLPKTAGRAAPHRARPRQLLRELFRELEFSRLGRPARRRRAPRRRSAPARRGRRPHAGGVARGRRRRRSRARRRRPRAITRRARRWRRWPPSIRAAGAVGAGGALRRAVGGARRSGRDRLRGAGGEPPARYVPLAPPLPGRAGLPARGRGAGGPGARCSRRRRSRKHVHDAKTLEVLLRRRGVALGGRRRRIRCWPPTCSTPRAPATTWTSSRRPRASAGRRRARQLDGHRAHRRRPAATSPSRRSARASAPRPPRRWRWPRAQPAQLTAAGLERLYRDMELPLAHVLAHIEAAASRSTSTSCASSARRSARRWSRSRREIHALAGGPFNINSPKQLGRGAVRQAVAAGDPQDQDRRRRPTPTCSRSWRALHPVPAKILEYRALAKLKGTYIDALPALVEPGDRPAAHVVQPGGRGDRAAVVERPQPAEHPHPHRARAAHPRGLRRQARARAGLGRLLADRAARPRALSGDPALLDAFRAGEDIHQRTAAEVFGVPPDVGDRRAAPHRQDDQLRPRVRPDRLRPGPGAAHPARAGASVHRQLLRALRRRARVHGARDRRGARHAARSRRCSAAGGRCPRSARRARRTAAYAERMARNTPIQGTAADLLKLAMIRVDRGHRSRRAHRRPGAALLLTVHDELVFEVPEARRRRRSSGG